MGGLGRYDLSRHHRRAARRLDSLPGVAGNSRGPFMRISTGLDAPQSAPLQCPCHMACGIAGIELLLTVTGDEKLIVNFPAAGPTPPGAPGRTAARVKYIAQRA